MPPSGKAITTLVKANTKGKDFLDGQTTNGDGKMELAPWAFKIVQE